LLVPGQVARGGIDWSDERASGKWQNCLLLRQDPNLKKLCEGSRRPVRGKRHELQQTSSRHAQATCPVCQQTLRVVSMMRVLKFPRHPAKAK
jgi:hypothetical protein